MLLIPATSDVLFPPAHSTRAKAVLEARGRTVDYVEIEGPLGHNDGLFNIAQAGETIRAFLN